MAKRTRSRNERCPRCGQKQKDCRCHPQVWWWLGAVVLVLAVTVTVLARHPATPPPAPSADAAIEAQPDMATTAAADSALYVLVTTCPDTAVSRGLDHLLRAHIVQRNFQPANTPSGTALAVTKLEDVPELGGEVPLLSVNSWLLLSPDIPRPAKWLVVRHEYVHLQQLLSGRVPRSTFRPRLKSQPWTDQEIRDWMKVEMEAYCREAETAARFGWWGAIPLIDSYRAGGRSGLARAVADEYSQSPGMENYSRTLHLATQAAVAN